MADNETAAGSPVQPAPMQEDHQHHMHREIYEQPRAVNDTLTGRIASTSDDVNWDETGLDRQRLAAYRQVLFLGCGSAHHAGLFGAALVRKLSRLPARAEPASEFRYSEAPLSPDTLVLVVSQSGETADTLAAMDAARHRGVRAVLAVTNVVPSTVAKRADYLLPTRAGTEVAVASTKAYMSQLVTMVLLAVGLGRAHQTLPPPAAWELLTELQTIPQQIEAFLGDERVMVAAAHDMARRPHAFYLGRRLDWVSAAEGQLKMKETSYIHAEAYAAGELRHGPMALVDPSCMVVGIVTHPDLRLPMNRNLAEVKERGAGVVLVAPPGADRLADNADHILSIAPLNPVLSPLLAAVPLQLLAYHAAVALGRPVDQPRNLVKSLTTD